MSFRSLVLVPDQAQFRRSMMEKRSALGINFEKFTWKIKNFSKLKRKKELRSDGFNFGGYPWRIYLIFPRHRDQTGEVSLYLKVSDMAFSPYLPVSFFACFRLSLVNQVDSNRSIVKGSQQEFSARKSGWGLQGLISLMDLKDPNRGYLVNDTCLIEAEIFVPRGGIQEFERYYADLNKEIDMDPPLQEDMGLGPSSLHVQPVPPPSRRPTVSQIVPTPSMLHVESMDKRSEDDIDSYSRVPSNIIRNLVGFYRDIGCAGESFVPIPDYSFSEEMSSFRSEDNCSSRSGDTLSNHSGEDCSPPQYFPLTPANATDRPADAFSFSEHEESFADSKLLGTYIAKKYELLLEKVCAKHPSLIACQKNKTPDFRRWAFTALGKVLYFLNTRKAKDMNDEACEKLEGLWDEVEPFRFDLTWLEPHVQSALGVKNYLEKASELKLLKDNLVTLEMDARKLRAELAVAEANLDDARRSLEKAEEEFQEMDVNTVLGYGTD